MSEDIKGNRNLVLISAAILAVGIVPAAICSATGFGARIADRAVTMRGLAERNVTADLATWTINFQAGHRAGGGPDRERAGHATILEFFRPAGFPAHALADRGGSINSFYDNNRAANIVTVNRRIQFRTADVMRAQRTLCAPVRSDPQRRRAAGRLVRRTASPS